jgi:hypothetical protein
MFVGSECSVYIMFLSRWSGKGHIIHTVVCVWLSLLILVEINADGRDETQPLTKNRGNAIFERFSI